jgi:hypothetical protein
VDLQRRYPAVTPQTQEMSNRLQTRPETEPPTEDSRRPFSQVSSIGRGVIAIAVIYTRAL